MRRISAGLSDISGIARAARASLAGRLPPEESTGELSHPAGASDASGDVEETPQISMMSHLRTMWRWDMLATLFGHSEMIRAQRAPIWAD